VGQGSSRHIEVKNKCAANSSFFRPLIGVMSEKQGLHGDPSWQPTRPFGKLYPSFRPSRTARAFSADPDPRRRRARGYPRAAAGEISHTQTETITKHDTRRSPLSVARSSLPHTYMRTGDPNHDADIRIGSEAPKQRLPILVSGVKAIGCGEQPLPRIVLGRSSLGSAGVPKLMIFCFSC
jgi:hypothetical protein